MKILELSKENENLYLEQIVQLEQIVLKKMKEEKREGQLFATGREGISEYIHSENNTVMVAVDKNENVESATYITQGQMPFTYNDITKYFKYGDNYKEYVKSQYNNVNEYKKAMLETYEAKTLAFRYAKNKILKENPNILNLHDYMEDEIKENGFHEKSELREKINEYMSEYISSQFDKRMQKQYEQFYWITSDDIAKEFARGINIKKDEIKEYEDILKNSKLKIYEQANFDEKKYYNSNTENSIELDTYITNPNSRNIGCARIIVYEGIKKHMEKFFANPKNKEIFLCSTLHKDNLSSKYVSEFFGLTDSIYVNRRQGRDREVHICQIPREQAIEYLTHISDKLAVLYGYNPNKKQISPKIKMQILQEQIEYEEKECKRLVKAKATNKKFKGINVKFIKQKEHKIKMLKQKLEEVLYDDKECKDGK